MRKNVGNYERIARLVLGASLAYLALSRWRGKLIGRLAMATSLELFGTVGTQKCPGNAVLGRNTYYRDEQEDRTLADAPA